MLHFSCSDLFKQLRLYVCYFISNSINACSFEKRPVLPVTCENYIDFTEFEFINPYIKLREKHV